MLRLRLLAIFVLLSVALFTSAWAIGPGDPAPDFTLQDVSGTPFSLSGFRREVVLLALIGAG